MSFLPRDENFMKEFSDQADIEFEADPRSLQRILLNREISPRSLRFPPSMTPVNKSKAGQFDKNFEFFESQDGTVFSRPRHMGLGSSGKKWPFAFGNGACKGVLPIRPHPRVAKSTEKCRSRSEKKVVVNPRGPLRESMSEQKHHPGKIWAVSKAKKGLDFSKPDVKKNTPVDLTGDSFKFAKPLDVQPGQSKPSCSTVPTLLELIMSRESIAGFPRESFSALLRQSLSKAELDRMFEDDSTGSFEKLEMRLKTPKRPLTKPNLVSKVPQPVKFDKTEQKSTTVQKKEEEIIEHQDPSTELLRREDPKIESECSKNEETISEEHLSNYEILEYMFEDPDMSLADIGALERTASLQDLRMADEEQSEENKVNLPRSQSAIDLTPEEIEEKSELLIEDHLEELEKIRAEQAKIEQQLQNLMLESLKRKQQFKHIWGVSPKSINQKRSLKTVLSAHNVKFSPKAGDAIVEVTENPSEDNSESQKEESSDFFGMQTPPRKNQGPLDDNDLLCPELETSISAELFEQFIDANLPPKMQGQNEGFNNVSDCIWQSDDETNIDNTESHIDVEQEEPVIVGQEDSIVNPLDPVDMDIESDKENKKDSEDLKSLIAAAVRFHQQEKLKRVKTVRFITPEKVHELSVDEVQFDDLPNSNCAISVNIPVQHGNKSSFLSFNESGIAPLPGTVHTPVPRNSKFKMTYEGDSDEGEAESNFNSRFLPTPMALRDISNRAQQALASLYSDVLDESKEENRVHFSSKKLFNDDSQEADD